MDPRQITRLAKLLRDNGDKVLNSEYKLILTGGLLRALNDSFSLIVDPNEVCTPQTFQVLKPNNAKSEVFRELQIIYDFVQKTEILCLTTIPNDDVFDGIIDISKFRNLKRLEIQRIPIEQIVGIQRLRAHLQEIICSRSINSVEDIISHCGGDKSNGFLWNELKMADFSSNCLKTIDCSLEFASNLQQLNLSHNQIVSVDAIKWLPNLKKLNLSYNSLTHIPQCIASRRLQTLILTNNFIEDLSGLSRLDSLSELNLADNCILDHATLLPLNSLIALQYLHLHGNPISCHPNHREETAKYLHKNTASVKFVLDLQPLTKYEKSLTGHNHSYNANLSSRISKGLKRSSGQATPTGKQTMDNTPANSIGSLRSFRMGGSSGSMDLTLGNDLMNTSISSTSTQKKIKIRPAIIADDDGTDETEVIIEKTNITMSKSIKNDIDEIGSRQHLETKKQIEELRHEYGDNWLHNQGATKVQNVMGIQSSLPKSDALSVFKSPAQTTEQLFESFFGKSSPINRTSTPINDSKTTTTDQSKSSVDQFQSPISSASEYRSADDSDKKSHTLNNDSTINDTSFKSTNDPLANIYSTSANEPEPVSDTEDNETIYLTTNDANNVDLIVIVSDQSIREKDALTTHTITKWNMSSLESCERIAADLLRLRFDTIKRDKKERTYQLEAGLGQKLEKFLRSILSKRPLSEMNQAIFRCANCTSQFSREIHLRNTDVKCPECDSTYVVEIREQTPPKSLKNQQSLEKCESRSSIAPANGAWKASVNTLTLAINLNVKHESKRSASSFNESLSNSKISQSQSSFDSNQSLIGSTTNFEQVIDLDAYYASRFRQPVDSDVEILSNPSISSIEVLDNFSRHSSRKPSEDRRYLQQTQQFVLQQQQHNQQQLHKSVNTVTNYMSDIDMNSNSNSDIEELLDEPSDIGDQLPDDLDSGVESGVNNETFKNAKKTILTGMNLTESSSSGSVTDSVCTAYENQTNETKQQTETTTVGSIVASTAVIPVIDGKEIAKNATKVEDEKIVDANKQDETSSISAMLGGLFNSTNKLMSGNGKTASQKGPPPCDKFKFSFTEFDNADHRLIVFLHQKIFENTKEQLKWLVKGRMFNDSAHSESELQPAIFVMSTTKWYILNIVAKECEDVGKWVKKHLFGTIDRVEMVRVLPWKIGITFSIKFIGNIHFVLQDIMRTDSLLLFFANNPLPCYCTLEYQISERISQKLLQITNNEQLKMLAILNNCKVISDDLNETYEYSALIITDEKLYLTTSKYGWLADKLDMDIEIARTQLMSNAVGGVDNITDNSFTINFLDDIESRDETWQCTFETNACLESTFNAIAQSWEKLFQVPLAN